RTERARRRRHERRRAVSETIELRLPEPDLPTVVHDALARLPQRFRLPVVLCDLQGLSYDAAAAQLRWTHAAVRSRLARGRQRLRTSLSRAGLAPAAGALALGVATTVPRALASTTARLAAHVAAPTASCDWPSRPNASRTPGTSPARSRRWEGSRSRLEPGRSD